MHLAADLLFKPSNSLITIIIRLALVMHIIIATSFVTNCQRHNFLKSTELFLAPFIIEIINKRRYLLK